MGKTEEFTREDAIKIDDRMNIEYPNRPPVNIGKMLKKARIATPKKLRSKKTTKKRG